MIFYKGCEHTERVITIVPGFVSSDPEEPIQFMGPGLYIFNFDYESLKYVDDWINGQDNNEQFRSIRPGVRGHEESLEVMINVPVKMQLVDLQDVSYIVSNGLEHATQRWLFDTLLKNQEMYGMSEQDIMSLMMEADDDYDDFDDDDDDI